MRNFVWSLASMVLVVCVSAAAWSSEADELRAKAKAVQNEAEQAAKEGRAEEAEKLFRHVKELLQAAQKHESKSEKSPNREVELHQQLKALPAKEQSVEKTKEEALAELRKHRTAMERELVELREHRERKSDPKHTGKHAPEAVEETGLRIKHIRVAVENLNAAGLHDIAEELAHKADAMEREHHQGHKQIAKESPAPKKFKHPEPERKHELPDFLREGGTNVKHPESVRKDTPVDELRQELQRLRAELNELREGLKKRP